MFKNFNFNLKQFSSCVKILINWIMHESIDLIDQNNSPNTAQTSEHSRNQVDVSKSICCAPIRDYINRTVQGPRLVLSTFLYISVLTIFVLTCYIIFQSFNYGFIKNREDMLVGTSQVVRINSFKEVGEDFIQNFQIWIKVEWLNCFIKSKV